MKATPLKLNPPFPTTWTWMSMRPCWAPNWQWRMLLTHRSRSFLPETPSPNPPQTYPLQPTRTPDPFFRGASFERGLFAERFSLLSRISTKRSASPCFFTHSVASLWNLRDLSLEFWDLKMDPLKRSLLEKTPCSDAWGSVSQDAPTTPDPNTSAIWEPYHDISWWCIYYFLPRDGHTFAKVSR